MFPIMIAHLIGLCDSVLTAKYINSNIHLVTREMTVVLDQEYSEPLVSQASARVPFISWSL